MKRVKLRVQWKKKVGHLGVRVSVLGFLETLWQNQSLVLWEMEVNLVTWLEEKMEGSVSGGLLLRASFFPYYCLLCILSWSLWLPFYSSKSRLDGLPVGIRKRSLVTQSSWLWLEHCIWEWGRHHRMLYNEDKCCLIIWFWWQWSKMEHFYRGE